MRIQNDTTLVVMDECMLWLDDAFNTIKCLMPHQLHTGGIGFIRCFCEGLTGFIIGLAGFPGSSDYKHKYGESVTGTSTWLVQGTLQSEKSLEILDTAQNSLYLTDLSVSTAKEIAPERQILTTGSGCILQTEGWQVVKRVDDE